MMNLFGEDAIIGNFQLSNYGLMLGSFESNVNSEFELGMNDETIEKYNGHKPVPTYLGHKFSEKLRPVATLIKNVCDNDIVFTEHECREILRQLTGFYGYRQMQIYSYEYDELLFFNVRINNVRYKKIGGDTVGIILDMECDSQFAWSKEYKTIYDVKANEIISFYNISDELYDYLKPVVIIKSKDPITNLEIKNISDNNRVTSIKNISANEVITMDSNKEKLKASTDRLILNDFNMNFIRLVGGINKLQVNSNINLEFCYKLPRKVGFI